jgi:hypothetical protein
MAAILAPADYVNTAPRTGFSTIDLIGAREIPALGRSRTPRTNVRANAQF